MKKARGDYGHAVRFGSKLLLFRTFVCYFLPAAGLFTRFQLKGMQEPHPGSVARAPGVQSRASWLVFKRSRSMEPSRHRPCSRRSPAESAVFVFLKNVRTSKFLVCMDTYRYQLCSPSCQVDSLNPGRPLCVLPGTSVCVFPFSCALFFTFICYCLVPFVISQPSSSQT